ncbi:hypothetical protein AB0A63_13880 [Lentzea sp. NPDC042327]|uniref:hypothetical protein n=1 Tax=Lentzea sp. NPDC042327 TaxID=3154801 RepID=UPI0033F697D9
MAQLTRDGRIREASRVAAQLTQRATDRELWLIHMLDKELKDRPRTAAAVFQRYYDTAPSDADRNVVLAFMAYGDKQPRRQPNTDEPTRNRSSYRAPSKVTTSRRDDVRRRRRSRDEQNAAAIAASYAETRAGLTEGAQNLDRDERTRAEQVYASGDVDYDAAALYRTAVELPCLDCTRLRERGDLDAARARAGHGDDGLCRECRADNRPGIAPLPEGHTLRDAVHARCAFIFDSREDAFAGLLALRSAFTASRNAHTRALIAEWVGTNVPDEEGRNETPSTLCASCGQQAARRDGVCADELCREFVAELAAEEAATGQTATEPEAAPAEYRQHAVKSKRRKRKADARTRRPANR